MGTQYGPYVMHVLSRLLQQQHSDEKYNSSKKEGHLTENNMRIFSHDETESRWRVERNLELLERFCEEGVAMAEKYGHFIVGENGQRNYIGIPGRFMLDEQPGRGKTGFTLWQPLKGGEEFYQNLEEMEAELCEYLYGYWIAQIDGETLKLSEA